VYYYYYLNGSPSEHIWDNDEENFLLLTNFYVVAMDTQSKQIVDADWSVWEFKLG